MRVDVGCVRYVKAVGEMENGVFVAMVLRFFCIEEAKVFVFCADAFFCGWSRFQFGSFFVPGRPKVLAFLCVEKWKRRVKINEK